MLHPGLAKLQLEPLLVLLGRLMVAESISQNLRHLGMKSLCVCVCFCVAFVLLCLGGKEIQTNTMVSTMVFV